MAGCIVFFILCCFFHEVQLQDLPQAELTVNSRAITETDSVTFSCQTPTPVSEHQCYFYIDGKEKTQFSCLETFTGTELLEMSNQSQPAVVEVKCFYTVKQGDMKSPHSNTSYISIGPKPQMTVKRIEEQYMYVFECSLPGSVKYDTACSLYFGESNVSTITTSTWKIRSANMLLCRFSAPEYDLLRWLDLVQQKVASCDFKLKSDGTILSQRSDPYDLTVFLAMDEKQSDEVIIQRSTVNADVIEASIRSTVDELTNKISMTPTTYMMITGLAVSKFIHRTLLQETSGSYDPSPTNNKISAFTRITTMVPDDDTGSYGPSPTNDKISAFTRITTMVPDDDTGSYEPSPTNIKISAFSSTTTMDSDDNTGSYDPSPTYNKIYAFTGTTTMVPDDNTVSFRVNSNSEIANSDKNARNGAFDGRTTDVIDASTTSTGEKLANKINMMPKTSLMRAEMWKLLVAGTAAGLTVVICLTVVAYLRGQKRTDWSTVMKNMNYIDKNSAYADEDYSVVQFEPAADYPAGPGKTIRDSFQDDDSDVYHTYSTIPDLPPESAENDVLYSLLQNP